MRRDWDCGSKHGLSIDKESKLMREENMIYTVIWQDKNKELQATKFVGSIDKRKAWEDIGKSITAQQGLVLSMVTGDHPAYFANSFAADSA